MHEREPTLLNAGLYTVPEAARLTRVSVGKIRRWLKGYDLKRGDRVSHSDPVWQGELRPIENKLALSFRDLLKLRFVERSSRWRELADHAARARESSGAIADHPSVLLESYFTDGRSILLRQGKEDSDEILINLANNQAESARLVEPFRKELEFSGSDIVWWPLGRDRNIIVDPKRDFGQPTVVRSGVPSQVLARSAKSNGSREIVGEVVRSPARRSR